MLALVAAVLLQVGEPEDAIAPTAFDQVILLEARPGTPGRAFPSSSRTEYTAEFSGTLHAWVRAAHGLGLRVEDASGETLADEDGIAGPDARYLRFGVAEGDALILVVESEDPGELELHLIADPETEATRAAAEEGKAALKRAADLASSGERGPAREVLAEALGKLARTEGAETSHSITETLDEMGGFAADELGSWVDALAAWRPVWRRRSRSRPRDHRELLVACGNLSNALASVGDLKGARIQQEALLEAFDRTLPEQHPNRRRVRLNLAITLEDLGELDAARAMHEEVVAAYEKYAEPEDRELLAARTNLARCLWSQRDFEAARAQQEQILATLEGLLPAGHPDILLARENLALSLFDLGELDRARDLQTGVLAAREAALAPDDPELLRARTNLAITLKALGDLVGAHRIEEELVHEYEKRVDADHPALLAARTNLASSLHDLGDLSGARALKEQILAANERNLPEGHPDILLLRENLAVTLQALGDLSGARALLESVLAERESTLPRDHPEVLRARTNLAVAMTKAGDVEGALALEQAVLAARERTLPEDHPDLLLARQNVVLSLIRRGALEQARALQEQVLAARERTLPADHPDLLAARAGLASALWEAGDLEGAREHLEAIAAARAMTLPPTHPNLLTSQSSLAQTMRALGDREAARALQRSVLDRYEQAFPNDYPGLLEARANLALSLYELGELDDAPDLVDSLMRGIRSRVLSSLALAPREAREAVIGEADRVACVLLLTASAAASQRVRAFELVETMRLVTGEAAHSLARFDSDPELRPLVIQATAARRELNDLVAGAARDPGLAEGLADRVAELALKRDALEREASAQLAERGVAMRPVELDALARRLGPRDAAVGVRRMAHFELDESGRLIESGDRFLAHVVRHDGTLERVDLGDAAAVEECVGTWRGALGAPALADGDLAPADGAAGNPNRGVSVEQPGTSDEPTAGRALRERIVDPILAVAGEGTERLFLCADDVFFLLPLDALPLEESQDGSGAGRVGERVRIVNEVSFARLLSGVNGRPALPGAPSLLSIGGVDYAAEVPERRLAALDGARSAGTRFTQLAHSGAEAEATAALFAATFEAKPRLLTGSAASKDALFEAAAGKRYLHLATHGWFAPGSVAPISAERASSVGDLGERVRGLAPMTLCGLALAGANRGRDSFGRVPGILTAEELCSLDLSACELAILSACETNVGIRRAGEGIRSLQTALYSAGAGSSITSLWSVDDAATRRLFELFYTTLWEDGLGKADSLWQAKMALRKEGNPVHDWAGWVLTGAPD